MWASAGVGLEAGRPAREHPTKGQRATQADQWKRHARVRCSALNADREGVIHRKQGGARGGGWCSTSVQPSVSATEYRRMQGKRQVEGCEKQACWRARYADGKR